MPKSNDSYWVLYKIDISAAHFSPMYSFDYIVCDTKIASAIKLKNCFLKIIDSVYNQTKDIVDEEIYSIEYKEIKEHFESNISLIENNESHTVQHMETSISMGWPLYSLKIIAEGEYDHFKEQFLNQIRKDSDFNDFINTIEDEIDNECLDDKSKQELWDRYSKVKNGSFSNLKMTSFLNTVKEVVYNDEG